MLPQPTVFLVDDERAVRESVCALLKANGLQVESFASGEEFLSAYHAGQPGCLVQDVRLEGMSGIELHHRMIAAGSPLPVIMISGHVDDEMAANAVAAGALAVLYKPVPYKELLDHIRKAIAIDAERRKGARGLGLEA